MRKLILYIATSLDGFIASPDGSIDWLFSDFEQEDFGYSALLDSIDAVLIGRKTFDQVLSFGAYPYSDFQTYLFTHHAIQNKLDNITIVSESPAEFVKKLKTQQQGKSIWLIIGGNQLIQPLHEAFLIDEYRLFVHPIALGNGIRLLENSAQRVDLNLNYVKQYLNGLVELNYKLAN